MRIKVQLVIESTGQQSEAVEVATFERAELNPGSLGLHICEAKAILEGAQRTMVSSQVNEFVQQARRCPDCGSELSRKGRHDIVYRTVFGKLRLTSPRLYHCKACPGVRRSFSPLAHRLTERSSPELQYLQAKFAALMSFGLTVGILGEVLPLDKALSITSVRRWADRTGQRVENDLRNDSASQAAEDIQIQEPYIPEPSPVKAIGVDGGYVRLAGHTSRSDGWFEVIVGKSQRDDHRGACFAYVQTLEPDPSQRMNRFLTHEGIRPDQPVTFLSDGGDTVRQAQFRPGNTGEWLLDWFHVSMRFQNLIQAAKGLPQGDELPTPDEIARNLKGAKWHLWHGCWYRSIERLESVMFDLGAFEDSEVASKLETKIEECMRYIDKNRAFIIDYGERYRHGDPIATGFVESAVNQVISKRFVKKQQMSWTPENADRVLQVRTAVLNEELRTHFSRWYPSLDAANDDTIRAAA